MDTRLVLPNRNLVGIRHHWLLSVFCALHLSLAPGCFLGEGAQQNSGQVVDDTGRPLPGVVVTLRPSKESDCRESPAKFTTDEHGRFGLCLVYPPTVKRPSFELVFAKASYETERRLMSKSEDGLVVMMKRVGSGPGQEKRSGPNTVKPAG